MEYVPSRPVQDVVLVPLTTTETLASGALRSSVTVPVMVCCCATARAATRRIPNSTMRTIRLMGDDAGDGDGIGHSTENGRRLFYRPRTSRQGVSLIPPDARAQHSFRDFRRDNTPPRGPTAARWCRTPVSRQTCAVPPATQAPTA